MYTVVHTRTHTHTHTHTQVTIVMVYFQLCSENYHWYVSVLWKSISHGGDIIDPYMKYAE